LGYNKRNLIVSKFCSDISVDTNEVSKEVLKDRLPKNELSKNELSKNKLLKINY